MSRLLRGRSRSCCESRPTEHGLALEHDVVDRLGRDRDRLGDAAELELGVHALRRAGAHHDARLLELLEARGHDLDAVGPGPQVRRLVAPLGVGLERARHAGGLVGDQDGGLRHHGALGVGDGAADRAEDRLGVQGHRDGRQGQENRERQAPRRQGRPRPGRGYERMSSHVFLLGIPPIPVPEPRRCDGRRRIAPAAARAVSLHESKRQHYELSSPFLFVCQPVSFRNGHLRSRQRVSYLGKAIR